MSASHHFRFSAVDTLFFGDGRPFQAADEGLADVRSVFPPYPEVTSGALRAAFARACGWDGRSRFTPDLQTVLGRDRDDPGKLWTSEPIVLKDDTRLYPAPLHVALDADERPLLLEPGEKRRTDRGSMRLLRTPDGQPAESLEGRWLNLRDFENVLHGQAPRSEPDRERKWLREERRIGIERNPHNRLVRRGQMYAVTEMRPEDGVIIGIEAWGLPDDLPDGWQQSVLSLLGGLQRLADISAGSDAAWQEAMPPPKELVDAGSYVVVLTSPMRVEGDAPDWRYDREQKQHGYLEATLADRRTKKRLGPIVAAAVGRPLMIGGWDGIRREPLPMVPCMPPGSVFFIEGDEPPPAEPFRVGSRVAFGYGGCRIGAWPIDHGA